METYPMTYVFAHLVAGLMMTAGFCFLIRLIFIVWPMNVPKDKNNYVSDL